jgi:hypothetical protein
MTIILDNDWPVPGLSQLPDGTVHLHVGLALGLPYRLEASSDFLAWETVISDIAQDTDVSFVEDDAANYKERVFRIVREFGDIEDD